MKKGNFLVFVSGIKKKPFLIPNVDRRDVVLDCTRVFFVPLWYKEVVEKICLGGVLKKKLYIGYYTYDRIHLKSGDPRMPMSPIILG